jgi:hypothetical protein
VDTAAAFLRSTEADLAENGADRRRPLGRGRGALPVYPEPGEDQGNAAEAHQEDQDGAGERFHGGNHNPDRPEPQGKTHRTLTDAVERLVRGLEILFQLAGLERQLGDP